MTGGTVRFTVPAARAGAALDERLFEILAGIACSWSRDEKGDLAIWTAPGDRPAVRGALSRSGIRGVTSAVEAPRDWVAESAALRTPVAVGRYLLDPHEGKRASRPGRRRRLHLPAARAFGTGSHESTRLALRLLLGEEPGGLRVVDAGCGAGTLAFVAALEGAAMTVAFDIDADAAFATREQARKNRIGGLFPVAGGLRSVSRGRPFDLAVANMILEELAPLLPGLHARLAPGGRLVTSGQLLSREAEWLDLLRAQRFRPVRLAAEGEWLGTVSEKA